jgi:hypothetical protein
MTRRLTFVALLFSMVSLVSACVLGDLKQVDVGYVPLWAIVGPDSISNLSAPENYFSVYTWVDGCMYSSLYINEWIIYLFIYFLTLVGYLLYLKKFKK